MNINWIAWYKNMTRLTKIKYLAGTCAASAAMSAGITGFGVFEGYYGRLGTQEEVHLMSEEEVKEMYRNSEAEDSDEATILSAHDAILMNLKQQAANLVSDSNVFNILLIGSDQRGSVEGDRSDSCILVSINSAESEITMTSFMRDCYVAIPGFDNNRLNAAYSLGGADLLIETIEMNFGIDINRYVKVDFSAFVEVVDALGGIDVEVSEDELYYVNLYAGQKNGLDCDYTPVPLETEGKQTLDGMQALAYSRIRKIGSDFERTERQRKVVNACLAKVKSCDIVDLNNLFTALLPMVSTDLARGECITLMLDAVKYAGYDMVSNRVPYDGTFTDIVVDGMQVLSLDFQTNVQNLQKDIYKLRLDDDDTDETYAGYYEYDDYGYDPYWE